jgi:ABC-2 type transport system ATP-binding protein
VAGRTVRLSVADDADLTALPGVTATAVHGGSAALTTTDAEATLRALLDRRIALADLEVRGASLEDAVLSLTSPTGALS